MAQEIGLSAVFDLGNFQTGMRRYTSSLDDAIGKTNKAAGSFGKSWNQMGATVTKVAGIMSVAVVAAGAAAGLAIGKFTADGISKAANLEEQLSAIAATLNMTAEQVAPLNDLILELGLDPNLKVSATEAADAIENLARNGLTMTEIIDGAARSTVLLANATGADFGLAADIATDTMALFNIEAANMDEAINGITGVTNASKFTIDDYRLALSQAGGVAAASGVSFDDFNAVITAISPSFASGSDAGTSFKTMLQRLIPQSTEAADMMMELGLMTEDGSNKFFDANGNMRDMNEIAVLLNGALAGLTEEQKLNAVTVLAGADASRAMLGLMEAGAVAYTDAEVAAKALGVTQDEVNQFIEGGITQFEALAIQLGSIDAAEQAKTRMDNFKGSLEILKGTIETLQIRIGQAFLPVLRDLADWATEWVATNGPAIAAAFVAFADNVSALIQYIREVATTGDLMNDWLDEMSPTLATVVLGVTGLAGAISMALGAALTFIQQHMDAFKGALIGIGVVLAAATITAGITAIAGAIATLFTPIGLVIVAAGLLGAAWNTNFLGMRDATIAAVGAIQEAFAPLTTAIQTFGAGALTEIQAFVTGNQTEFTNLQAIWTGAQEAFGNTFLLMQEASTGLLNYLREQFPQLTPVFDGFSAAVSLVAEQVQAQWTLLQEATSAMIGLVTALIAGDWAGAWQSAQDLAGAFVTYVTTTFANLSEVFAVPFATISTLVTETFTGLVTTVNEQLPTWQTALGQWGLAASQWVADASVIVTEKMTEWKTAVVDYVVENLPTWQTTLAQWGTAASQWIVDAVTVVATRMATWGTAVLGYVTTNLPTWQATLLSWGTAAWKWITDEAIPGVTREIGSWYANLNVYVTNNLPNWIAALAQWGTAAWQWIVDAIPLVAAQMAEWGDAILGYVTENLPTWQANLEDWTTAAWEWIVEAVPLVVQELGNWYTELSGALAEKLPTWQTQFTDWITALWEWIVDAIPLVVTKLGEWYTGLSGAIAEKLPILAVQMLQWATVLVSWIGEAAAETLPKLGEWLGEIIAWIPTGLVLLAAEMLKFATALVTWIGTDGADAIPALGEWMGKILAWIPLGVDALVGGVVKLAGALISWISGSAEGVSVPDSATGQLDAEFGKFLDALRAAIVNITGGFVEGVKAFVDSWKETMSEHVDWNQLGVDIMTFIQRGVESMVSTLVNFFATTAQSAFDAFLNIDWQGLGSDIIDGIMRGLRENGSAIVDYIVGLGSQALDKVKSFFGISSPSRVMAEVGKDIIEGWLIGMQSREHELLRAMQSIADGLAKIAGRAGANAIDIYASALGGFASLGGGLAERLNDSLPHTGIKALITAEQGRLDFLKQQADLVNLIRESGADPEEILAGIPLGFDADPFRMAELVARTMAALNRSLQQSLRNTTSGLDREINEARERRESIADVEERMTTRELTAKERYAEELKNIDRVIANVEENALKNGNRSALLQIQQLDNQRRAILAQVEKFVFERQTLDRLLTRMPTTGNQRAQEAIDKWRKIFIDPMLETFDDQSSAGRQRFLIQVQQHMTTLQNFAQNIGRIAAAETNANRSLQGFGEGARSRVDSLLNLLYSPSQVGNLQANLNALQEFSTTLNNIRNTIEQAQGRRLSTDTMIERLMGGFDQLQQFKNAIAAIDRQISISQELAMERGDFSQLAIIRSLDNTRLERQAELEQFVYQSEQLAGIMKRVKNLAGPGQAAAERFLQESIQPIVDAFNMPMRAVDRQAWLNTATERVTMLNRFVDQMRDVERLQARIAGNKAFDHLADEFAMLQDILIPAATRGSLINQLNSYITQMSRLHEIQQDITVGRGINPLVERFASQRLDAIARQLEDINMSEMQRAQLIEQYRVEQEKILALQQKQQQLQFLQEQLGLVQMLESLNDEFDDIVSLENIFQGITLGINASMDDMLLLTSRAMDALLATVMQQLGIASPSRVMAGFGRNLMQGLSMGIQAAADVPLRAIRSAAGNLIPYSLTHRSLAMNMGGVTINNMMDDVMFESRIRQIIRSEFGA